METLKRRSHPLSRLVIVSPPLLWLVLFFAVPLVIVFAISFFSRGDYGELQLPLTLENYKRVLGFGELGFDPLYPIIFLRSVLLAFVTAGLCLVTGLPLAFFIARLPARWKSVALMLVVIPFWTNLLIRTYAWQLLLAPDSPLTALLHHIGIGKPDEGFYPGTAAVLIGMVCDFLPFLVLPLYASVEKIDWSLAEAAADLGADKWNTLRHAILPQIRPGMIAGLFLVFLPAMGQFVIPDLLGGAKTVMLGNIIQQQFSQSRDWQFGAAISFVALILVIIALFFQPKTVPVRKEEL